VVSLDVLYLAPLSLTVVRGGAAYRTASATPGKLMLQAQQCTQLVTTPDTDETESQQIRPPQYGTTYQNSPPVRY